MKETTLTPIKELGRLLLLSVVSFLLSEGLGLIIAIFGGNLSPETKILITGVLTYMLKALDRWLHEIGKETEEITGEKSLLTKGLTRF